MNDIKENTFGAGAGFASYLGLKQLAKRIHRPYSQKVMQELKNYSPQENEILKKAIKDAFEMSGLKKSKVHMHSVNTPAEVSRITKLLTRKIDIFKKNNIIAKFFKKFGTKFANLTNNAALDSRKFEASFNRINANKETIENLRKAFLRAEGKPENIHKINHIDINKINKKILPIPDKMFKELKKIIQTVARGKNAFFNPVTKDIIINEHKMPSAAFHEMGHALNATGSKLMKSLAIGRHVSSLIIVPVILAISLLKPKKSEFEKPTSKIDKTTTFIKENAGKLSFAALTPTLLEEGIASIRGGSLAKKVLSPDLLKKVNKRNFFAWTTYLAGALLLSGITAISVKIRDKVAAKNNT